MRNLFLTTVIATFGGTFATHADTVKTIQTGYILSIWFGYGESQTQSFAVFEGQFAAERCDSARQALKGHINSYNGDRKLQDDWAKCLPLVIDIPNGSQTN